MLSSQNINSQQGWHHVYWQSHYPSDYIWSTNQPWTHYQQSCQNYQSAEISSSEKEASKSPTPQIGIESSNCVIPKKQDTCSSRGYLPYGYYRETVEADMRKHQMLDPSCIKKEPYHSVRSKCFSNFSRCCLGST